MNKQGLVSTVAGEAGLTSAEASRVVEAVIGTITRELSAGGEVRIAGFGNFSVAERAARTARNPRTGESIEVPAAVVPKFRPAKGLKESVNG